uniref:NADH dehydrogenase subunit 3 n=1 Tax=Laeocathaica amdoana TaxID=2936362 RepID=UPI0022FD50AA|nr:NADH dehydrogenase subunit 3 [Laeocathaica amdoana]WBF92703.1 NADH dehydrogenase subunit 3 [Laeocathaica amdoana]
MLMSMVLASLLCGAFVFIFTMVSFIGGQSWNKSSPFECGFEPFGKMRKPFSLRYYVLVVLFLIFDVEAVLLFPCVMNMLNTMNMYMYLFMYSFILMLMLGLLYEYKNKMLEWST